MYQARAARWPPPPGFSAVSSAPHSLPLAYITCCMRLSLESGREITSLCAGWPPNRRRQQPIWPLKSSVVVSLIQKPCGTSVVGAVPDPGCCCFGGTPYWFTVISLLLRLRDGEPESIDAVLVSVHSTIWFAVRLLSKTAIELKKNSVPPLFRLKERVPGDCAGHTVKPGSTPEAVLTSPAVSNWTNVILAAPAASCAFESAEICAARKLFPCVPGQSS